MQANHAKDRADILGIMARAEQEFHENEADAKHEYSSIRDDVKNIEVDAKHEYSSIRDDVKNKVYMSFNMYFIIFL